MERKGTYVTQQDLQEAMQLLGETGAPEQPRGFSSPNFTQIPNDLLDELMSDMSESEFRVVMAICRATYGYHRVSAKLGIAEISEITGLSYTAVANGAREAEKRGLIRRTNPESKTKAEWEIIETPQRSEGVCAKHPNVVRVKPQRSEGQVGLNKEKESDLNKEEKPTFKKGDIMDGILAFGLSPEAQTIKDIRAQFEKSLRLSPPWDGVIWRDFDKWLIGREKSGQPLAAWVKWWRSDEFRETKQTTNLTPDKIKLCWPQAFDEKPPARLTQPQNPEPAGITYAEYIAKQKVTA